MTRTSIDRDHEVYARLLRNVAVNGEDVGEAMISGRWRASMDVDEGLGAV
jgi:hypothetical protein